MKSKSLLFVGIFLLIAGVMLRKLTSFEILGLCILLLGVACKTIYIISKARNGEYKPGKELLLLFFGLFLLMFGIYLRSQGQSAINPTYLILSGIALKVVFIIRFIQIVRSSRLINK